LRAARERAGWSREALAYHSGVSWSAIAQIESGRRKQVRPSSLSALAGAMNVSVDYLLGNTTSISPKLLEHRVLPYGSDEEFLAGTIPFLTEGIEQSHALLVVTSHAHIELIRDTLSDRSGQVEFIVSSDFLRSPVTTLIQFREFMKQKVEAGAAWIRIVGEPIWVGRSPAEIIAWTRFESLFNLEFASFPATAICPYDVRALPEEIVADASRTHPEVTRGSAVSASPTYEAVEQFLLAPQASK
jgi:transcriptional regulator with XRE-family HTH domain